jgi:hypothetical protein
VISRPNRARLGCGRWPQHGPVQHPENHDPPRIGGVDTVDDEIRQAGNYKLPRAGRPARPAPQREIFELPHSTQYPLSNPRGSGRVVGSDPCDKAEEIVVRRLGPANCHGWGLTTRSNAATTVA